MSDDSELNPCSECLSFLLWSWGHGLGTNRQTVLGETNSIRRQLTSPDRVDIAARLDKIERVMEEIVQLPSPSLVEAVRVNSLVAKRVEELQDREPYRTVEFRTSTDPSDPSVLANRTWLRRLLDGLIDNALDAMSTGPRRTLSVGIASDATEVRIIVSDTGRGIDSRLLESFFDLSRPPLGQRGRGRYATRLLVDIYQGKAEVRSSGPDGTLIVVSLPRHG